jgi:hypothetical protein
MWFRSDIKGCDSRFNPEHLHFVLLWAFGVAEQLVCGKTERQNPAVLYFSAALTIYMYAL